MEFSAKNSIKVNPPGSPPRLIQRRGVRVTKVARQSKAPSDTDCGALENAFAQYQGELLGTLYYLVGNIEDARDALQETFVKCWRHKEKVAEVQNLKAWIFRIAMNTGRDLRQTAWRRKRQGLPDDEGTIESSHVGPEVIAQNNERLERVRDAVRELRSEEQEVFLLRQNGELKYEEIAETVGIPLGTVKTRMRLAITKLRESLAEESS
ncbi:MAG: RNA polymerase subunit sigma [Planctomycetaceae bacterium]|jgi:RNA polymerase sigma-70 factor (ECF subfamily)|nr:RNA polymerase subunit sigma [Planctomycetaceae bacterium]